MREVTAYKATDGSLFLSKEDAAKHEATIGLREVWLAMPYINDAETFASEMVERAVDIAPLLNAIVEATPRPMVDVTKAT